jgi:hypothetical protein
MPYWSRVQRAQLAPSLHAHRRRRSRTNQTQNTDEKQLSILWSRLPYFKRSLLSMWSVPAHQRGRGEMIIKL